MLTRFCLLFSFYIFSINALYAVCNPPNIIVSGPLCDGGTVTLNAGAGYTDYDWSNSQTGQTITVSQTGIYTVTVTCPDGSTATASKTVVSFTSGISATTTPICPGASKTLSVTVTNGAPGPYTIVLFNSTTGMNQTFTAVGASPVSVVVTPTATTNYTLVSVTNPAGCQAIILPNNSVSVNVLEASVTINGPSQICPGQTVVLMSDPQIFNNYLWSTNATSPNISVTQPGTYSITVTTSAGCTATSSFVLANGVGTPPTISGNLSFCTGGSTVLTVDQTFNNYNWSNGQTTQSITVSTANTYTVTATSASGCTATTNAVVTVSPNPVPTITGTTQVCPGGSTTLTVPQSFATYTWSNGSNTNQTSVSAPGPVSVTVTNATGCSGTASVNVTTGTTPSPTVNGPAELCSPNSGTLTVTGGSFTAFAWSNSQTTATVTINAPGTYSVTVTNAAGCTGTDDITVQPGTGPSVSIAGNALICGNQTTTFTASAMPTTSNYVWSNGISAAAISVSLPGNYTVTATLANGCTGTASVTLELKPTPMPQIDGPSQICLNATATLSVTEPFQSYTWATAATTASIQITAPGNFTVTVTNAEGCTASATKSVTLQPGLSPNITAQPYQCNGQMVLDAGSGFDNYTWTGGSTGQTLTVSTNGNYVVTVSNTNGCTGTDNFVVSIPVQPTVTINGAANLCENATTTLQAAPANLASYAWSTSQNGASISINSGGTYIVTATDAFGCTATDDITINTLPAPVPNLTGNTTVCQGTTTTFSLSSSFSAYAWSNAATTATITVGTANTYTVTVTGSNGCTGTDAITLSVIVPVVPNIVQQPYQCNGQLTLDAGGGYVNYNWSNMGNAQTVIVNVNGNYIVTVTDAAGCSATDSFVATIPAMPNVNITGAAQICDGSSTVLQATAGFVQYAWSNSSNTSSATVNQGGTYFVTVTDAFGCTDVDDFNLTTIPAPQPNITGPTQICAGSTATFALTNSFNGYAWSNGQNTPSITVSTANTYTVTVTASNGCTGTDAVALTISTSLQPQITQGTYQCNNTLTLDAGSGFSTYNWSNSQNAPTITVTNSGNYSVTVTDAAGCSGSDVFFANIPPLPTVNITGDAQICDGETTILQATPGLAFYQWSTGQAGSNIAVSDAAQYLVTATDANGCTATASFTVNVLPSPQPSIMGVDQICAGNTTTFSVNGVFASYLWSTNATTPNIQTGTAGNYSVTVTDGNGCTGTDNITLTVSNTLSPQITAQPYQCNGILVLSAGAGYATYNWTNGETTATISVNSTDNYGVTVANAGGCTGDDLFFANVPAPPNVTITGNTNICAGQTTQLMASSGFSTYLWSNSATTQSTNVNNSGTYLVTATDASGCTATKSITINAAPPFTVTITGPTSVCTGNTANFNVNGSFLTYLWSSGATTQSIGVSQANTYYVTVTAANGCTGTASVTLAVANSLSPTVSALPYQCNDTLTLSAGNGYTSYNWSNGATTATTSLAQNGTYLVTVSDANGCSGTGSYAATIPVSPTLTITGNDSFCVGESTELVASSGFATYLWSNSATTQSINANESGVYSVSATDAQGCGGIQSLLVNTNPPLAVTIDGPSSICTGNTANFSVTNSFSNYIWSNSATTQGIEVSLSDTYSVTVTGLNGCTGSASVTLAVADSLSPIVSAEPYQCNDVLTLSAGSGYSNYIWSNGATTENTTVSQSGTYSVTVSDANGCSGTSTYAATVPVSPTLTITGNGSFCAGQSTELMASSGFTAYLWSNSATTQSINVDESGIYSVSVTDAQGCGGVQSILVNTTPPLTVTIDGPSSICTGNTAIFSVNGQFSNYLWSNSATTPSIDVSLPGTYLVTVTGINSCTGTASVTLTVESTLSPTVSAEPYQCNGELTLLANSGYVNYTWSNGATTENTSVAQTGTYSVTVLDANGCSSTGSYWAIVPVSPILAITGNANVCLGQSTALTASNGFAAYLWSNSATTQSISVNESGIYSVTATDANSCESIKSFEVNIRLLDSVFLQKTTCNSAQLGTNIEVLTNQFGCDSVVITQTVLGAALNIAANIVSDFNGFAVSCAGSNNGKVETALLSGGIAPFDYQWSNGSTDSALQDVAAGTYRVTITDATGCSGLSEVVLAAPVAIESETTTVDPDCSQLGRVVLGKVNGGVAPFNVQFGQSIAMIDGSTAITFDSLSAGAFSISITDSNGCTHLMEGILTALPPIQELWIDTIPFRQGDTVLLAPPVSILPISVEWSPIAGLSCTDCLSTKIAPRQSTEVVLSVQGLGDCSATARFILQLQRGGEVFTPNILDTQSSENNRFTLFADWKMVRIRTLNIYSRWGESVAVLTDIAPNDTAAGWDGRFGSKTVLPGVYVWLAEVEYVDGTTEVLSGEILVVR